MTINELVEGLYFNKIVVPKGVIYDFIKMVHDYEFPSHQYDETLTRQLLESSFGMNLLLAQFNKFRANPSGFGFDITEIVDTKNGKLVKVIVNDNRNIG
ncbi:MAG: hypothetical protein ACRDCN_03655 [Tannerellaceae bacterium]